MLFFNFLRSSLKLLSKLWYGDIICRDQDILVLFSWEKVGLKIKENLSKVTFLVTARSRQSKPMSLFFRSPPRSAHNHKAFTFAPLATFRLVADNGSWHPGRSIVAFFAPPTWSSGAASRPFGPWQRHVTSGLTGSIQATMTCTQLN